jgi:hypothetical protein
LSIGRIETVLSYLRQVAIHDSVRETIKRALAQSDDVGVRLKANAIPAYDGILRSVSLYPSVNTEETLKDYIIEHILESLRLTADQRERLNLSG